jgi:glycosyltransferase involved in cell wall biosynthesis
MKILIAHNSYQQRGGEDVVAATEAHLLAEHGHQIVWYRRHNDELKRRSRFGGLSLAFSTVWARNSYRDVRELLRRERPDVAHFHNTFPLISPSAYYACSDAGVPVVQTLHNYRLLCPNATLYRDAHTCEQCLSRRVAWPAIAHRCYRESAPATFAVASMLAAHRALGTWRRKVNVFVAVSSFVRTKFVQAGFPAERVRVKPNFVHPDPGGKLGNGDYALYVGRLSQEKGVRLLLEAWRKTGLTIPLRIVGSGPLASEVDAAQARNPHISALGPLPHHEVIQQMRGARFLVFSSVLYEAFPLTVTEAFACGLPVVGPKIGPTAETIVHRRSGLHFEAGNADDLGNQCLWAWSHPEPMRAIGRNARTEYESKYAAEPNYDALMQIYEFASKQSQTAGISHSRDTERRKTETTQVEFGR